MKDIKKDITSVIKTGKMHIGSNKVLSALLTNNPKLLTEDKLDRINAVINLAKEELLSNKS